MTLTPRGMSVQEAYRLFAEQQLSVNRRYQRKLVWSEDEKRHLIDSIEKKLPIPLFMFVSSGESSLEIIDGMQRLNAIFSFIEHQFSDENQKCFNVDEFSRAKISRDAGVFTEFDAKVERLSADESASFLEYQLAVMIDTETEESRINEMFGRINSGGRRLSPQEQRQAGLVSNLTELVRKVASEIRNDSSPDLLILNEMPEVSISTPREKQRYGIDSTDVFWCKHHIIFANDLARSVDEQVVSDIAISILNGEPLNASREVFDIYFDPESKDFQNVHAALAAYGADKLRSEIIATVGAIRTVFETGEFLSFRNCVHREPRNPARTTFFAVFMAFHDLMFKQSMFPDDSSSIRSALNNVQKDMIPSAHHTTTEDRNRNIAVVTGLIQPSFVKKDIAAFGSAQTLVVELENSLRRSKYEASRYEFKIGICRLDSKPILDPQMISKLGRTAAAIANTDPSADGYIYIGVADKLSAAERLKELNGTESIRIGEVFFTGIRHDLDTLSMNLEEYVKYLIKEINRLPMSNPLRTQLATAVDHAEYQGHPFVRMRIPRQGGLTEYNSEYPVRKNSETVDMTSTETVAQLKLFEKT